MYYFWFFLRGVGGFVTYYDSVADLVGLGYVCFSVVGSGEDLFGLRVVGGVCRQGIEVRLSWFPGEVG